MQDTLVLRIPGSGGRSSEIESLLSREWLVTNGLGGYASGTVAGVITRRYHGLLIAALAAPLGRMVMLSHVAEQVRWPDGKRTEIGGREQESPVSEPLGSPYEFRAVDDRCEIGQVGSNVPPLRLLLCGPDATFTLK